MEIIYFLLGILAAATLGFLLAAAFIGFGEACSHIVTFLTVPIVLVLWVVAWLSWPFMEGTLFMFNRHERRHDKKAAKRAAKAARKGVAGPEPYVPYVPASNN